MSIFLTSVHVRHERRIRVSFTNNLAAGAFGAPAPSFYSVVCTNGRSPDLAVQSALLVSGSPNVVELVLASDIVKGVIYTVTAVGVPASDASTTDSSAFTTMRWGQQEVAINVEPKVRDKRRLVYGVDIIWTGSDFQETATGDLERVEGPANVSKALNKRVQTNPGDVRWDTTFGAGAREYVDSPSTAAGSLQGAVSSQLLEDPRVKSIKVSHEISDEKTYLYADPVLVSGETVERVSIEVPNE